MSAPEWLRAAPMPQLLELLTAAQPTFMALRHLLGKVQGLFDAFPTDFPVRRCHDLRRMLAYRATVFSSEALASRALGDDGEAQRRERRQLFQWGKDHYQPLRQLAESAIAVSRSEDHEFADLRGELLQLYDDEVDRRLMLNILGGVRCGHCWSREDASEVLCRRGPGDCGERYCSEACKDAHWAAGHREQCPAP